MVRFEEWLGLAGSEIGIETFGGDIVEPEGFESLASP